MAVSGVQIENIEHPVFCFRHMHPEYCLEQCDNQQTVSFIKQLVNLSKLTWQQITQTHRHGMGFEKMTIDSLKAKCPPFVTEDVEHLLAFRYDGKKPFLGLRNRFIFHVISIEREFGELYNHG